MQMENRICFFWTWMSLSALGKHSFFGTYSVILTSSYFFILILNGRQVCEIDILILARFPLILSLAPPDLIELKQFVYLLF